MICEWRLGIGVFSANRHNKNEGDSVVVGLSVGLILPGCPDLVDYFICCPEPLTKDLTYKAALLYECISAR